MRGNTMIWRGMGVAFCLTIGLWGCKKALTLDPASREAALGSAQSWLALVDTQQYPESHAAAASYFKGALTAEKWHDTIKGVREPLGKVVSRKVRKTKAAASLPGAPDGKYLVIIYDTSFEKKEKAQETVTPMLDADGTWRVAGYYIK